MEETLELALTALRQLGQPLPRNPSWLRTRWAIARTDWLLPEPDHAWNPSPLGLESLLGGVSTRAGAGRAALTMTSMRCLCLGITHSLRAMHGYVASPALTLAAYANWRGAFLRCAVLGIMRTLRSAGTNGFPTCA
jgi:hypothetical protein